MKIVQPVNALYSNEVGRIAQNVRKEGRGEMDFECTVHRKRIVSIFLFKDCTWKQDPEMNMWSWKGWEWRSGEGFTMRNSSFYRLPNMFSWLNLKRLGWAGHVARMKKCRSSFRILRDKPTRIIHLGRPRRRWDDTISLDFKYAGFNTRNRIDSAHRLLETPCECGIEPRDSISHGVSIFFYYI